MIMENNIKKVISIVLKVVGHIIILAICFTLSIMLCMGIFDDILGDFTTSQISYMAIRIFLATALYILILKMIFKKTRKIQINILAIIYMIFILCLTFLKGTYGGGQTGINLDPFQIYNDFQRSSNSCLLFIGNIAAYIPIGVYLHITFKKRRNLIILFIIYSFTLEGIQYITKTGFFDINDVILNTLGFGIGLIYSKKRIRKVK